MLRLKKQATYNSGVGHKFHFPGKGKRLGVQVKTLTEGQPFWFMVNIGVNEIPRCNLFNDVVLYNPWDKYICICSSCAPLKEDSWFMIRDKAI